MLSSRVVFTILLPYSKYPQPIAKSLKIPCSFRNDSLTIARTRFIIGKAPERTGMPAA